MLPLWDPSPRWIPGLPSGRLGIMPRPRGGEDLGQEVSALAAQGVGMVVSLLEPAEARELELQAEGPLCAEHGIRFVQFPIPDRGVPESMSSLSQLLNEMITVLTQGGTIAVHCRAGIGRTGVVAACALIRLGLPRDRVFQVLSEARGLRMPDTAEQESWVKRFAGSRSDTALGGNARLRNEGSS
jgi:protein-tyrosine phosphatase